MTTGDPVSLSTEGVWKAFREPLRQYVARRLPAGAEADDVLQDIFVKVHTRLGELRDEERLAPWLYRIARNAVIDRHRRPERTETLAEEPPAPVPEDDPDAARSIARGLGDMIRSLPEGYREALVLSELEGLPQREVAARLGLSLSGAKSRVQRGRRMLRDALLECCHFDFDRRGKILSYTPKAACCRHSRAPRERAT